MKSLLMENIPLTTTFAEACKQLRLEEDEDIALLQDLFAKAKEIARPKAMCIPCSVDLVEGASVIVAGVRFESELLAEKLRDVPEVMAYAVTCGVEVDVWSHREQDYIVSLWLDMIKEMFLLDARTEVVNQLKIQFGCETLSNLSPGSGNVDAWPIVQQRELFALLGDVKDKIGVTLTESCLMLPTKSVSGLIFPSEHEFINCMRCNRENCVRRKAPYQAPAHP